MNLSSSVKKLKKKANKTDKRPDKQLPCKPQLLKSKHQRKKTITGLTQKTKKNCDN